jgi:BirA family transcriptional regulator, biotin operon repressor / biotin---[acetyl-CoA-carboxylase] ligase
MSALSIERVSAALTTQRYGRSLRHLASTDSTNDDARREIEAGAVDGHVVVADAQARGRGSRGRAWSSPAGTDLYLSIVDRVPVALAELPPLTLAVGLGVADAVDQLLGGEAAASQVKWPNDVLLDGKKCAGILIEASTDASGVTSVVIGIGLNVNRLEFPDELSALATSLRLQRRAEQAFDRNLVLAALLANVERWVDRFVREGAASSVAALTPRLALLGRRARCGEEPDQIGIVRGVDPSGALLLETARGVMPLIAGRLEALDP